MEIRAQKKPTIKGILQKFQIKNKNKDKQLYD